MRVKSQESSRRFAVAKVKSRTMRWIALLVAIAAHGAIRSYAQCQIDPVSGQQICFRTPDSFAGAPALDSGLSALDSSALDSSAHCRIAVGDGSMGSGTLVGRNNSRGLVLTCAHLFDGAAGRIVVTFSNGQRFAARLIGRDRAHDLAVLAIRRPDAEPIAVSHQEPGGLLVACGFGPEGNLRCIRGAVTGQATAAGAVYPSLTIAGAVRPGDSGGGVLDAQGRLAGVIWGQRDGQTYATCGRPVREFVERLLRPRTSAGIEDNRTGRDQDQQAPSTEIESRLATRIDSLEQHLRQVAASEVGFFQGLSLGKLLVGALGVSGPLAAAIIVAARLAGRRVKKRGATQRVPGTEHGVDVNLPAFPPIAVDSPPLPQRSVPETHYVPFEKDSFARAHQWASEQVARKYPGATEILQAQDSLIKQHLAAQ